MIPLFSSEQVRNADKYAINELGIPGIILMENASISIKTSILETFSDMQINAKIGIICGKGNNGGDGYAVARHLTNDGYTVIVISLGKEKELSSDAHINFRILKKLSQENKNLSLHNYKSVKDLKLFSGCDMIIDAMLGTGTKGELREPYPDILDTLNLYEAHKVAIDIPTGIDVDLGTSARIFNTDLTVTLAENKKGLFFADGYLYAGIIKKGSIGIGAEYFKEQVVSEYLIEAEDAYFGLPVRNKGSQKYSAGKVLSIAGSGKYPGAACLCSNSVLNIGAGASLLAFPNSIRSIAQKKLSSAVVLPYNDENKNILTESSIKDIEEYLYWADVVALGPGLGRSEKTVEAVNEIIGLANKNQLVIDADAINALGKSRYKSLNLKNQILTPHHKEFSDLIGISLNQLKMDFIGYGKNFVEETGAYLVLKGAPTIIFSPSGEVFINTSGNSGMSKFGVGDVLTGTIAGFVAQSENIEEAIISAVYIHSLSADLLVPEFSEFGITAELISNNLGKTISFLRKTFD